MQIDFHHTVTYVLSRMAGFPHNEAEIIAYAAQYVDDANNSGVIKFDNGAMYHRISSVNGTFDVMQHVQKEVSYVVWSPFHFLPGADPKSETFVEKLICRPNSDVANRMVDLCIKYREESYALQRLGITMHVYADTFAHQGFAGIVNEVNTVNDLELQNEEFDLLDKGKYEFVSKALPMGHGAALECPDKPYLVWSYTDYKGEPVNRNNTEIFMDAAYSMFAQLLRYRQDIDGSFIVDDNDTQKDMDKIKENFLKFTEQNGEARHKRWLESIKNGDFTFGPQELSYASKGVGSWKYVAIEQLKEEDDEDDEFMYTDAFLDSNWKRFHDALQEHRLTILHEVLPDFKICLA